MSSAAYLKTPTAFGFTGVFRRLARKVGILTEEGRLDEGGYELVISWAKDQGLDGFIDASSGDGRALRERLRGAVSQGMEKGHTTHQAGEFWRNLAQRFDPARPGRNETRVLLSRILSLAGPVDMIQRVTEALVAQGGVSEREGEAPFLRKLSGRATADLMQLLTAIDAYEAFARAITDAFNSLRHCASKHQASRRMIFSPLLRQKKKNEAPFSLQAATAIPFSLPRIAPPSSIPSAPARWRA